MTILVVIYKTVDPRNNFQWPCSICPIPQFRLVEVRTSIYIFNVFLDTPLQFPLVGSLAAPCYDSATLYWLQSSHKST